QRDDQQHQPGAGGEQPGEHAVVQPGAERAVDPGLGGDRDASEYRDGGAGRSHEREGSAAMPTATRVIAVPISVVTARCTPGAGTSRSSTTAPISWPATVASP